MKDFELISHTADLKIRVYGQTLQELFRNAVIGMFQSISPRASGCSVSYDRLVCPQLTARHEIKATGPDPEALLVNFLSQILYVSDVNNEAYLDANITELTEGFVNATIRGVKITGFDVEIKAVTYHDLHIEQIDGLWQTDIVFDI